MKNNSLLSLAFYGVVMICGALTGVGLMSLHSHFFSAMKNSAVFASETEGKSLNAYASLPCPTEAEFQNLAAQINLEIPPGPSIETMCDENHRATLSKVLRLMNQVRIHLPDSWPEKIRTEISHPFEMVKAHSSKMTLDLNQQDSVAYNKVADRAIFLGGRFFTTEPLDAVSILVHEARHSAKTAPSHTLCLAGDLPRSGGACDQQFSLEDSTSGAYSYGSLFHIALALYTDGLSEDDREYAMVEALAMIGARFNELPAQLARKVDLLAILTQHHSVELVHPFTGESRRLNLKFDEPGEFAVRIDSSPVKNGLFVYTNRQRIWVWSPISGLSRFYAPLFERDVTVSAVGRVRVPFNELTLYVAKMADGSLKYADYDPQLNRRVLLDYPLRYSRHPQTAPPIERIFLAWGDESVYLDENGRLHLAQHFADEDAFMPISALQSTKGWRHGTGGVLYDSLYLVDRSGALQQGEIQFVAGESDQSELRSYELKISDLKVKNPIKKFSQGLRATFALDDSGKIHVWSYESKESRELANLKTSAMDFALVQVSETNKATIGQSTRSNAELERLCRISKPLTDLWFGSAMGKNDFDQFVVANSENRSCQTFIEFDPEKAIPYFDQTPFK